MNFSKSIYLIIFQLFMLNVASKLYPKNKCYELTISKYYFKEKYFKLSEKIEDDPIKTFHYIMFHSNRYNITFYLTLQRRITIREDYSFNFATQLCEANGYDTNNHFLEIDFFHKSKLILENR